MATNEKLARRTRTRIERRGSLAERRAFGVQRAKGLVDKVEFESRKVAQAEAVVAKQEKVTAGLTKITALRGKLLAMKIARGLLSVAAVPETIGIQIFERIQGPLFRGKITREQFKSTFGTEPEA